MPNDTSETITVAVSCDTTVELDETFFVNLSSPSNATILDNQGLGTIQNDDVPTLSINDVSQVEGNAGTSTFAFTVTLSQASSQTVTVNYATADNTATVAGNDYVAGSGTLTFAPGDYDGDARNDLAVYRDGVWFVLRSSDSAVSISNWGLAGDRPVSGDFDGDGSTDIGIYRAGVWWIQESLTGTARVIPFGIGTDIPTVGDYDGDGTSDIAVFRPADGDWYVLKSSDTTITGVNWGLAGDVPIPAAYLPQ